MGKDKCKYCGKVLEGFHFGFGGCCSNSCKIAYIKTLRKKIMEAKA